MTPQVIADISACLDERAKRIPYIGKDRATLDKGRAALASLGAAPPRMAIESAIAALKSASLNNELATDRFDVTLDEEIRAALASLTALAEGEEGWQSMETAPKDGSWVQLWWPCWHHVPISGYFKFGTGWVTDKNFSYGPDPLAWMPLPKPPPPRIRDLSRATHADGGE